MIEYLSIHQAGDEIPVNEQYSRKVADMETTRNARIKRAKGQGLKLRKTYIALKPRRGDLVNFIEEAKELTEILSTSRSDNYRHWMEVGWCLHTINPCLLDTWIQFSQKSHKFVEGECESIWGTMEDRGLGISSLRNWAKMDNFEEFTDICRKSLITVISTSMSGTTYDIAAVVYEMFKYEIKCVNPKKNIWCVFKNHRWHMDLHGTEIMFKIGNDLLNEYLFLVASNNLYALENRDEADRGATLNRASLFAKTSHMIRDINFRKKIAEECKLRFYDSEFVDQLNKKPNLVGFENGVYDLDMEIFRDGRPEDMISISTGNLYQEYNEDDEVIHEIFQFMEQLFVEEDLREYVWIVLAVSLWGENFLELFWFLTGSGGNGKSALVRLIEMSIGDYTVSFPSQLLTQARPQANAATPAMHRAVHSRFGSFQELEEHTSVNIAYFKLITGGDKLPVRGLYQEMTDFKPQFSLVICCNHLPKLPPDDEACWRRARVIPFKSRFVAKPDPSDPFEFPRDSRLSSKMESWKQPFTYLLLQYYKKFKTEYNSKLPECGMVNEATNKYQMSNDVTAKFVDEMLIKTGSNKDRITITSTFQLYKSWIKANYDDPSIKKVGRDKLKSIIARKFKQEYTSSGSKRGWIGYKLRSLYEDSDDEDDDEIVEPKHKFHGGPVDKTHALAKPSTKPSTNPVKIVTKVVTNIDTITKPKGKPIFNIKIT